MASKQTDAQSETTLLSKVLYVAPLWVGSTCVPRLDGLRSLVPGVDTLDTTERFATRSKIVSVVAHRAFCTSSVRAMNRTLLERAQREHPDLIWIDKGDWIYPSTLRSLRRCTDFIVGHNTDDLHGATSYNWLYKRGLRYYDFYLTTNRFNTTEVPSRYGVPTVRAGMGFDHNIHKPPVQTGPAPKTPADLLFVGHWEPHTENYIGALQKAGLRVEVWGHNWWKARNPRLHSVKPLAHAADVQKIADTPITLCFLSHWNRNESTGRSFHIPAVGAFMLAERTVEHEFIFGDGKGASLFSNAEELVSKARYYLEHEDERRRIAAAGCARVTDLGLSWADHIRREWRITERILTGGHPLDVQDDRPFWPGFREGRLPPLQESEGRQLWADSELAEV